MMGDSNNAMDPELGRSNPKSRMCLLEVFLDCLKENRCIEIWRDCHQEKIECNFFPGMHSFF